jgi:hypothetical protein
VKTIRVLAFRGIGTHREAARQEAGLIRVGHVGVQFEESDIIYGFHPTAKAVAAIGGIDKAIAHLKAGGTLMGTVQDDTAIFERARTLSVIYKRSVVWQIDYTLSDADYARIRRQVLGWYARRTPFLYGFARVGGSDNCATFLRRLRGLPLPHGANWLELYVRELRKSARRW